MDPGRSQGSRARAGAWQSSVEQGMDPGFNWKQLGAGARRWSRPRGSRGWWPFVVGSRAVEDNRKLEQGPVGIETGEVRAMTKAGEPGRYQKCPALVLAPAQCSGLLASYRKRLRAETDEKRPRAKVDGPSALLEAALVHRGGRERSRDGAGAGPST